MRAPARAFRRPATALLAAVLMVSGLGLLSGCPDPEPPVPPPECDANNPCPDGRVCESGRCVLARPQNPEDIACNTEADCPTPYICRNGRCALECRSNAECGANAICQGNRCVTQIAMQNTQMCTLGSVYFDYDQSVVRADQRSVLDQYANCVRERGWTSMTISGHCDNRGDNAYNLALGDRRANAVRNYLRGTGLNVSITAVSRGEENANQSCGDESCWWRDRRGDSSGN